MSTPLVLLVSRSASRSQNYREALDLLGISCLAISGLKEVPTLVSGTPFNGIMLDMPVLIKATPAEKTAIEDILKALPSAYLNIAPASDSIRLLIATGTQGNAKTLDEFAKLCQAFPARLVHQKDRFLLNLQTLLSPAPFWKPVEQTITINVSLHGCFLFSPNPEFQLGQQISLVFIGLADKTPVNATICWLRRWGEDGHSVPGLGVSFTTLTETQQSEIQKLLEPLKPH